MLCFHCIFDDNGFCASCQNMHCHVLLRFEFDKVCGFLSGMFSLQCQITDLLPGSSARVSSTSQMGTATGGGLLPKDCILSTGVSEFPLLPTTKPSILLRFNKLFTIYIVANTNVLWLQRIPLQFLRGIYKSFPLLWGSMCFVSVWFSFFFFSLSYFFIIV